MNILIIGEGKIIYFLGRTLISKGHTVTIINQNETECVWLARNLKAVIVHGDGSDPNILSEAGIERMDEILAITSRDEDNLVIAQLADFHFKVPKRIALVHDPDHEKVFNQLGITAISTIRIIANIIEERARLEQITNLSPIIENKVNLTEIELTNASPATGKTLMELGMPKDTLIAIIMRDNVPIVPGGMTRLRGGDRLFVVTLPENHGAALKLLTGES